MPDEPTHQHSCDESCPTEEQLRQLCAGTLDQSDLHRIEDRIGDCPGCQERLEQISGESSFVPFVDDSPTDERTQAMLNRIRSGGASPQLVSPAMNPPLGEPRDVLPPSETEGAIGQIGKYRIESVVGHGGMGMVFRAHDCELQRDVAVKILRPDASADSDARDRFLREARSAAAIDHENVLPIHDMGTIVDNEIPYLVLPFIEGETLDEKVKREGALPVEEIVRLGTAIASGLGAAHERGLIHRDVKPANVLLERDSERVLIADFGLARTAESEGELTGTGMLMGTPQYMSPEQVEGRTMDHRSDLFSLGGVLYLMATGQRPFGGDTALTLIRQVADTTPVPPRAHRGDLPDWLDRLIRNLMQKDPDKRIQTAAEVLHCLQQEAAPSKRSRNQRTPLIMAFAAAAALVAFFLIPDKTTSESGSPNQAAEDELPPTPPDPAPFRVGEESFASLQEALQTIGNRGEIEIAANGPIVLDPIDLGKTSLLLRAAPGYSPLIEAAHADEPLFRGHGKLAVVGLHLIQKDPQAMSPIFEITQGALRLANCQLSRSGNDVTPPLISINFSNHLDIINSALFAPSSIAAGFRNGTGSITLENSIFWNRKALRIVFNDTNRAPEVSVSRNIVNTTEAVYDFNRLGTLEGITMESRGNTLVSSGLLLQIRGSELPALSQHMSWQSDRDQVAITTWLESDRDTALSDQEAWNDFWGISEGMSGRAIFPTLFTWLGPHTETPWNLDPIQFRPAGLPPVLSGKAASKRPGIRFVHVGPGEATDLWIESEEGKEWLKQTRRLLR